MIAILVITSILVTAQVSLSFTTSLVTIAVATSSGLVIAEMLRALARTRARAERTLRESEQRFRASEEQQIAEAHGGHITVDSAVGQGSIFTLWIRATVLQDDM